MRRKICGASLAIVFCGAVDAQEAPYDPSVGFPLPSPKVAQPVQLSDEDLLATFDGDQEKLKAYKIEWERLAAARLDLESQCGNEDNAVHVEKYSGANPTVNFVMTYQSSIGQIQWNKDLKRKFKKPDARAGNVNGVRWCSGGMISDTLFLTAGHCFPQSDQGYWSIPKRKVNGEFKVVSREALAVNMHVNFNYQLNSAGFKIEADEFPIVKLHEAWLGKLDYAIVELGPNSKGEIAGKKYGRLKISATSPDDTDQLVVIQHPNGDPKKVANGTLAHRIGNYLRYSNLDTWHGSSGSPVLNGEGKVVGVHVHGGCDTVGYNAAVRMRSIRKASGVIQ